MEIRFAKEGDYAELVELGKTFACEGCCNGIKADDEGYFRQMLTAVACEGDKVVGLCTASVEVEERARSFAEKGDKFLEIDEIYVLPDYRNLQLGQRLFKFMEKHANAQGCKTLRLNAVSKNYQKLLHFYIDKLGMDFWSAYLIKPLQ